MKNLSIKFVSVIFLGLVWCLPTSAATTPMGSFALNAIGDNYTTGQVSVSPGSTLVDFDHGYNMTIGANLATASAIFQFTTILNSSNIEIFDSTNTLVKASTTGLLTAALNTGNYLIRLSGDVAQAGKYVFAVTAVPIPAAAILFGTALFGFTAYSTRRKIS